VCINLKTGINAEFLRRKKRSVTRAKQEWRRKKKDILGINNQIKKY